MSKAQKLAIAEDGVFEATLLRLLPLIGAEEILDELN
jgi:hypothetical protein